MVQGAPPNARSFYFLQTIGRLKPGVTLDGARADMAAVAAGLAQSFPATSAGRGVALEPLHDALIGGELRATSLLFLAASGVVLLICCANVAGLLLARASSRSRELAIRAALGASRRRVVRQLLTESLVLSTAGGLLALGVGALIRNDARSLVPPELLPAAVTLTFDLRVVVFCAAAALLVGLLFGLAPAWQATGSSPARAIGAEGRTATGRGTAVRAVLVGGEVTAC
jgi:putative ABC transport system permease protein